MRRICLFGFLGIVIASAVVFAEPHWNNQATITSQDNGDSLRPFSVSVGSTTPVLVYYSTQTAAPARNGYPSPDRVVTIQNIQNFKLFCSTSSGFTAAAGNRFQIFASSQVPSNVFTTNSAPTQLWCVFETAAGSGLKEILGWVGYDSGD